MQAAVYDRYGGPEVVRVEAVPKPAPRAGELLVRVATTTVSTGDARIRAASFPWGFGLMGRIIFGVTGPRTRVLGGDLAGVVEAVGTGVARFRVGDAVVASVSDAGSRAHAEYCVVKESGAVVPKPPTLGWAEAAACVFGGVTAYQYLHERAAVQAGERVLVVGASGAVGSAAVQLARAAGATVTAVASEGNHALLRSLGAEATLDYRTQDYTDPALATAGGYDIIVDTTGRATLAGCTRVLRPGGLLLLIAADLAQLVRAGQHGPHRVIAGPSLANAAVLGKVVALAEQGTLTPLIDSRVPFTRIADAHARADSGHKRGNVVVDIWTPPTA
jgi:NADPH:quinone reductase-like Zn-dependent oxidoreductase